MLEKGEIPSMDRPELLNALGKICSRLKTIPDTMRIENCLDGQMNEEYGGGFATVSRGEYRGRKVAIKILHLYVTSDLEECFDVRTQFADVLGEANAHCRVSRNFAEKSLPGSTYNIRISSHLLA